VVNRTSRAPAATLFRLEADGGHWAEWAKPLVVQSSWERQGAPAPGGLGAVRKVGVWPLLIWEQTLEYEQDRRHIYALIGPRFPAKGYRGEMIFTRTPRGAPTCAGAARSRRRSTGRDR
jgi:Polyketide cyclase / dehydrase and lipid transport